MVRQSEWKHQASSRPILEFGNFEKLIHFYVVRFQTLRNAFCSVDSHTVWKSTPLGATLAGFVIKSNYSLYVNISQSYKAI